jgi:hypothetical protein
MLATCISISSRVPWVEVDIFSFSTVFCVNLGFSVLGCGILEEMGLLEELSLAKANSQIEELMEVSKECFLERIC